MDEATSTTKRMCRASRDRAPEQPADSRAASPRAWDLWPPAEIIPHFQRALPMRGREVQALRGPLSPLNTGIFPRASSRYPSPLPGLWDLHSGTGVCGFCFW